MAKGGHPEKSMFPREPEQRKGRRDTAWSFLSLIWAPGSTTRTDARHRLGGGDSDENKSHGQWKWLNHKGSIKDWVRDAEYQGCLFRPCLSGEEGGLSQRELLCQQGLNVFTVRMRVASRKLYLPTTQWNYRVCNWLPFMPMWHIGTHIVW